MIAEDVRLGPDSVTPDVLCHACRSLFESEATWHHLHLPLGTDPSTVNELTRFCRPFRNVGDIHRCAQAGCHLCVYMRYDLNNFPRHTATSRGALHHGTKRSGFENYELLPDETELLVYCGHQEDIRFYYIILYAQRPDPHNLHVVSKQELQNSWSKNDSASNSLQGN